MKLRFDNIKNTGRLVLFIMVAIAGYFVVYKNSSINTPRSVIKEKTSVAEGPRPQPLSIQPVVLAAEKDLSVKPLNALLLQLRPSERILEKGQIHFLNHALRLWGRSAKFEAKDILDSSRLMNILLDDDQYSAFFPKSTSLLLDSDYGISVRVGSDRSASPHVDKTLSVFAELGVPLDYPVRSRRQTTTLLAILKDSMARFQIDQDEID